MYIYMKGTLNKFNLQNSWKGELTVLTVDSGLLITNQ